MNWWRWLKYSAIVLLALTFGLLLFFAGEYSGREKERAWWQEKMVERGQMHFHEKSGKLHWKSRAK